MNKDARNLTRVARMNLYISDSQLRRELELKKQKYFNPTASKVPGFGGALEDIKEHISCICCNRIPLDIKECHNCQKIICKSCLADIVLQARKKASDG
jgi:hypothetical protein